MSINNMNNSEKYYRELIFNQFEFCGRLMETPVKSFTKNKQLFTRFLLKTSCGKNETQIPLIMFGEEVDVACTKLKIGDIVCLKGQIMTRENKNKLLMIDMIVTEIKKIASSKIKYENCEDKFKQTIALYDLKAIDKRMND